MNWCRGQAVPDARPGARLVGLGGCGSRTADASGFEIVPIPEGQHGFAVLSRPWVVERFFGWLGRCRRLAGDHNCRVTSSFTWLRLAIIPLLRQCLGRAEACASRAIC